MHHLIKDTEIIQILNHLCEIKGIHKKNRVRLRNFIEAICYISRATGQFLLADKGYDSNHFIETIQMH